ncbi:MAG: hypothetical protein R3B72_19360 [Polyangiaceae bacterium]
MATPPPATGYRRLKRDDYGRVYERQVTVNPGAPRRGGVNTALVGIAIVVSAFFVKERVVAGGVAGLGLVALAASGWLLYTAHRLETLSPRFIELTRKVLRYPQGRRIWTAETEELALRDLGTVDVVEQHGFHFARITSREGREIWLHEVWFGDRATFDDFVKLLSLRAAAAAARKLDLVQWMGREALAFEGTGAFGVVVDMSGKKPRARWVVDDLEGYAALLESDERPADHKLVCPSEVAAKLRAELLDPIRALGLEDRALEEQGLEDRDDE